MRLDPDSFRGKLYLLVIDKLAVGAVIACAFVAYDSWKTVSDRRYADAAKQVQLEFERAKLAREFIPVLADQGANVVTKAYLLRSALATGSIDPEAGIELGRVLIPAGLEDSHFKRVMAAAMPHGIPAMSRHASDMARRWRETQGGSFRPTAMFNPESGQEAIPDSVKPQVLEARLWRAVLLEAVPRIDSSFSPLQRDSDLARNIFGFFVLINPGDQFEAIDLSNSPSRGVALTGNISRLMFSARDEDAARAVSNVLLTPGLSKDSIALSSAILAVLQEFGPPHGGLISDSLARLLTHEPPSTSESAVRAAYYWLQWQSADLLDAIARASQSPSIRLRLKLNPMAKPDEWAGVNPAKKALLTSLQRFTNSLRSATDEAALSRLAQRHESGKLMRRVVSLVAVFDSLDARTELAALAQLDENKFRHFPFLKEDVNRALAAP
jgi:hypothetical protein